MTSRIAGDLAGRLRFARSLSGLTQQALGDLAGVTGPYICQLEGGHRTNPRALELEALARALGVTTGWLLHGEPEPDPDVIRRAGEQSRTKPVDEAVRHPIRRTFRKARPRSRSRLSAQRAVARRPKA